MTTAVEGMSVFSNLQVRCDFYFFFKALFFTVFPEIRQDSFGRKWVTVRERA